MLRPLKRPSQKLVRNQGVTCILPGGQPSPLLPTQAQLSHSSIVLSAIPPNTLSTPACPRFKNMAHENKFSTLKSHKLCLNCLRPGYFVRQCKSVHHCQKCQKPHHTLLHVETKEEVTSSSLPSDPVIPPTTFISSHAAVGIKSNLLPEGVSVEARALLDSSSSTSFISQRLVNSLSLPCMRQNAKISGVTGLARTSALQSITKFIITPVQSPSKLLDVTAVITPHVTCDLPLHPIRFSPKWNHLSGIPLADPDFGSPALDRSSPWSGRFRGCCASG